MIKTYKGYTIKYAKARTKWRARMHDSKGQFINIAHYGKTKAEAAAKCIEILDERLGLTKPLEVTQ